MQAARIIQNKSSLHAERAGQNQPHLENLQSQMISILLDGVMNDQSPRYVSERIFPLWQQLPPQHNLRKQAPDLASLNRHVAALYQELRTGESQKEGAKVYDCKKPLDALEFIDDQGRKNGPEWPKNPLFHEFLCLADKNGDKTCGGQGLEKNWFFHTLGRGKPSEDHYNPTHCKEITALSDETCIQECLQDQIESPKRPIYGLIGLGTNCQEYVDDILQKCTDQCREEEK